MIVPFTLFHLGPALLIGLPLRRRIDLVTFLIANVILDIWPALVLFGVFAGPYHGFFHTYLGAAIVAGALTGGMLLGARLFPTKFDWLRSGEYGVAGIAVAALSGTWLHVTLDSLLHPKMNPFFPVLVNPLYGYISVENLTTICQIALIIGLLASLPFLYTAMTHSNG